ncbi:MAG: four-carbon acid sugar kinase family protein [Anaerolineae bacterium]|nr:four-carbon acid sugar kinase family protein [Anaerolineae bacterium]
MQTKNIASTTPPPILGVVADDITGANDIGSMTAKAGYLTDVFSYQTPGALSDATVLREPNVCILDTDSRFDMPEVAYAKVYAATRDLKAAGAQHFFKKTCSVFRGNVGVEFDAMLDALEENFAIVVAGFPKNGRQTLNGIHYVRGVPLAKSEFRNDPVHPLLESNLVTVLQSQTRRKVALVDHAIIAQGATILRQHIAIQRERYNYLLFDVIDQSSLTTIAAATHDAYVFCGSSALGEELPRAWGNVSPQPVAALPAHSGAGVLIVSGSLMPQTTAQIQHLRDQDIYSWKLEPLRLFDTAARTETLATAHAALAAHLSQGEDALLYAANDADSVAIARQAGARHGMGAVEVSRLISSALAELTTTLVSKTQVDRLAIAGGDTSAAICARLGVTRLRILEEIQPGLPSCLSVGKRALLLVLKSGSFGTPTFLAEAVAHLRGAGSKQESTARTFPATKSNSAKEASHDPA